MIRKTYWLLCNNCSDPYWDSSDNVTILRRKAKNEGWHVSKQFGDICPKCVALEETDARGMV